MKGIIMGESSGRVRDAFVKRGHDVMSCDLLPSDSPGGKHYQGDIFDFLASETFIGGGYEFMICHPPCTYLCSSGLHWNKRRPERALLTEESIDFVKRLWAYRSIMAIVIENPIGCLSTEIGKPTQIIQPYDFGEDASKSTCLWIYGFPKLVGTQYIEPRIVDGKKRWGNQTDSGQNNLPPSADRWKIRSETYQGIANAMAEQWG